MKKSLNEYQKKPERPCFEILEEIFEEKYEEIYEIMLREIVEYIT